MLLRLHDVSAWLGLRLIEMWLQLAGLTLTTVMVAIRVDIVPDLSWWLVFAPLFAANAFHSYFVLIVFVRRYLEEGTLKAAAGKSVASHLNIILLFLFEALVVWSLERRAERYGVVFIPLFVLAAFLGVRACQIHAPH